MQKWKNTKICLSGIYGITEDEFNKNHQELKITIRSDLPCHVVERHLDLAGCDFEDIVWLKDGRFQVTLDNYYELLKGIRNLDMPLCKNNYVFLC